MRQLLLIILFSLISGISFAKTNNIGPKEGFYKLTFTALNTEFQRENPKCRYYNNTEIRHVELIETKSVWVWFWVNNEHKRFDIFTISSDGKHWAQEIEWMYIKSEVNLSFSVLAGKVYIKGHSEMITQSPSGTCMYHWYIEGEAHKQESIINH